MKRPISILCISDLHFEATGMEAIKQLHKDYNEFVNQDEENVQNKRWHPDYIVVAGDIVNYGTTDYSEPDKSIEQLMADFGIDRSRVILVPGNHDKTMPKCTTVKKLDKSKKIFDDFCGENGSSYTAEFQKLYSSRFKNYIGFCEKYYDLANNKSYEYYVPGLLGSIKCLSGIKAFKDDHLCFVNINTEWTYVSKKPFKKHLKKSKLTNHQKVYENCQLCAPLIKDVYDRIAKDFPHYTIVTVMHRGFEDLTWEENNVTNPMAIDAVEYLRDMSDIILTGHDHTVKTAPPTLIQNRTQHFRLGSAGRKESVSSEHIRTASIIRISPFDSKLEMMHLIYKKNAAGKNQWDFQYDGFVYPLYSKYDRNVQLPSTLMDQTVIKAQSIAKDDIQRAIETYFKPCNEVKLYIVEAIPTILEQELNNIAVDACESKRHYIVIYCLHHLHCTQTAKELATQEMSISEKIEEFKKNHFNLFVNNCLIIKRIIIRVPIFEFKLDKKASE